MVNYKTLNDGRKPRRNKAYIPILEPEEINKIIMKAKNPRDKCLVALLYLLASL
jgi:integrase